MLIFKRSRGCYLETSQSGSLNFTQKVILTPKNRPCVVLQVTMPALAVEPVTGKTNPSYNSNCDSDTFGRCKKICWAGQCELNYKVLHHS